MKWPKEIVLIRHAQSAYNVFRKQWENDPEWRVFESWYEQNHRSHDSRIWAQEMRKKYKLGVSDWNTPATTEGLDEAQLMATNLMHMLEVPDVIFVSPYTRTRQTLEAMIVGWPVLANIKVVIEERIREQEHGLATLFNTRKVFMAHYPDQKELNDLEGEYWYRYPQGENVPDVRTRGRDLFNTLTRDYSEQRVWMVTHHLCILSIMAAIHRWEHPEFIDYDENHKPINCGVTRYYGDPDQGLNGKLILDFYNQKLY